MRSAIDMTSRIAWFFSLGQIWHAGWLQLLLEVPGEKFCEASHTEIVAPL